VQVPLKESEWERSGGIEPSRNRQRRAQEICAVECSSKSCKCMCWRASSEKEYLVILKKSSSRRNRRPRSCGEDSQNPVSHWIFRNSGEVTVTSRSSSSEDCEPLDQQSISRQPSDLAGVALGLSPSEQRRVPGRHRDIGGIGVLEVKKLETPRVSKHRQNHSRGSRTGHASEIQSESGFGISGFLKTKESLHQESRFRDTR
jgi:hypothetical protein